MPTSADARRDGERPRLGGGPGVGGEFFGELGPLLVVGEDLGGHPDAGREQLAEQLGGR